MFGPRETRIAEIYKKSIDMYDSNEIFRNRLTLDIQTGSLIITNIRTTNAGLYKLLIISNRGTSYKRFYVDVKGVFGVDEDEVKSVSVMEGDSVTLHTDITQIQSRDQIVWMFGPQETRIAEIYQERLHMDDSNEIFGDRLKLDSQTGSLIITNITTTNSGIYKLQTRGNTGTSYKRFIVTAYAPLPIPVISSNSSYCPPSSKRSSISKCVVLCSVLNVTDVSLSCVSDLNTTLSLRLEVKYQDNNTYRCVLNNTITNQTQLLNITHLCQTSSGVDGDEVKSVSVMEGDSVTLNTDISQIRKNHQILWMFESQGTHIAQIIKWANLSSVYDNERFRDRLKLDSRTGSLTITNIKLTDSGLYKLTISNFKDASYKRFNVIVYDHSPCCSLAETVSRLAISAVVGVAAVTVVVL
ncbi:uncharacterized protein [Misgurnus anguillicaudatus]|uniref:uncharacterized protein n=1 Tax=Misgurnus anguillicaudatus TaxID=75329 RepID=UPI003CCF613D